jgi:hypothetical protein
MPVDGEVGHQFFKDRRTRGVTRDSSGKFPERQWYGRTISCGIGLAFFHLIPSQPRWNQRLSHPNESGERNMEQTPTDHTSTTYDKPLYLRGMGVASFSLGFFSMLVFWWFPFGLFVASAGFVFGSIAYLRGVRVGDTDNLAFVGPLLCATSISIIITYRFGIDFLLNR